MTVSAPADKRFRRARVSPRKRRLWRMPVATLIVTGVGIVLGGIALYVGAMANLGSEALAIQRITVSGNTRLSRGEVVSLLDGLHGRHMLTTNLEVWRQKLRSSPWVADAALRRIFPGTIAVAVLEKEPVGVGRVGDALYLVDRDGSIIDSFGPNYAELDLPIIDGLATGNAQHGLLIDPARAALAARVIDELSARPDLAARVSQVDVTDQQGALLILKEDSAAVRVGDRQIVERLQAYLELAPVLRERVAAIDYVDLRFGERVYVKPQARRGAAKAGASVRRQ